MKLKIIWSKFAENQLDKIYNYYEKKATAKIAEKIIREILIVSNKLSNSPLIGPEEELLRKRKKDYRYLVIRNYKIIYFLDKENKSVNITDIFDTRQNPVKIKRTK